MRTLKKLTMTLALLITAVSGAWAQEETLLTTITPTAKEQASYSTANVATVSFSYTAGGSSAYLANWGWWGYGWTATVTPAEGYTITKCIFYDDADRTATDSEAPFVVETTEEDKTPRINGTPIDGGNMWSKGIKKIEVYGYKSEPDETTEWSLTPDETGKKWTLDKMPASNIELQVEYYAESNLFLSKNALADKANIAVTAGELGVQFGDDGKSANTITEGTEMTVKYNGTKKVIGFKVAKKAAAAAAEGHALSASVVGEIVGSDGKAYAVADKDNLPQGVTAVAMVAYKSGSNGLAIQLNGSPVEKEWDEAKTYAEGLSAVTGGTWRLPSKADWQNMFLGCAVSGDATSADDTMNPIAGFKAKIAATGITWKSFYYWSSTEHVMGAWSVLVRLDDSNAAAYFDFHSTSGECTVLACLVF